MSSEISGFEHYEVLTHPDGSPVELGRGSMGVTYKAFDRNLHCHVALKVINAGLLDDAPVRERFLREARSAARLRHPHVASVFHLGVEGSNYFYAMEFIDGEDIESYVRRNGPISLVLALELALQVCRALGAAEREGFIHRDIKPANLMLVQDDGDLLVKVIDFGLAMAAGQAAGSGFEGTPYYASPEQLEQKEVDIRSDIYSLGATLWFMLTGRPPFTGTVNEILRLKLEGRPPWAELGPAPAEVTGIIKRMLAPDPAARFSSPAELRAEFERCLALARGEPAPVAEQAVPTANPPMAREVSVLSIGAVLAGRYRLLRDLGERTAGRVFQAEDLTTHQTVCVNVLRHQPGAEDDAAFRGEFEQWIGRVHPNLLRVYAFERLPEFDVLAIEWATGFPLIELLRVRRSLRIDEVLLLLDQAAAGIAFASERGVARLLIGVRQLLVHFPGGVDDATRQRLMTVPVSEWPAFEVKIYPLGGARGVDEAATWLGGRTLIDSPGADGPGRNESDRQEAFPEHYAYLLGKVAYELLGGTFSGGASRYVPMPALSEEGNQVLKRSLSHGFSSAPEFVSELRLATGGEGRAGPALAAANTTMAPVAAAAPSAARRSPRAWILSAGLGAAAVVIGVAVFFGVRRGEAPETRVSPPNIAARSPDPITEPTVASTPAPPEPLATAAPEPPTREEQFEAANAALNMLDGDESDFLAAAVALVDRFPEQAAGRDRLEAIVYRLWKRQPISNQLHLHDRWKPRADPDDVQFKESMERAAKLGVVPAMVWLGNHLKANDPASALSWYESAGEAGETAGMVLAGQMRAAGQGAPEIDLPTAAAWFKKAADLGDPEGLFFLGACYLEGKGVPKDPERGVELLSLAAAQKHAGAMSVLGDCYVRGTGVERDLDKAVDLFEEARDAGDLNALVSLGILRMNGQGVEKDAAAAARMFEEGAKSGNYYCMYFYAMCLTNGSGVKRDLDHAKTWMRTAAEAGFSRAIEWVEKNNVEFEPNVLAE
jgi:serine/threonine protein kinase/TPR repeat protein